MIVFSLLNTEGCYIIKRVVLNDMPYTRDYVPHLRALDGGREPNRLHEHQSGSGEDPCISVGVEGGSQGQGPERGFSQSWGRLAGGPSPHCEWGCGGGTQVWTSRIGRGWSWFDPRNQTWAFFSLVFIFFLFDITKFFKPIENNERILYQTPIHSPPRLNNWHFTMLDYLSHFYPSIHSRIYLFKMHFRVADISIFPPQILRHAGSVTVTLRQCRGRTDPMLSHNESEAEGNISSTNPVFISNFIILFIVLFWS